MNKIDMQQFMTFCKEKGIIFPGSEIYGGLANSWDYGPIGIEIKNNLKNYWWNEFVRKQANVYGLDSTIILNPKVWEASGHVGGFSDPLVDCKSCKSRFRADKLLEEANYEGNAEVVCKDNEEFQRVAKEINLVCPKCGGTEFTDIRSFNLMFETSIGVTEDSKNAAYLRPETAQGIFINFLNVQKSMSAKLPFGVAQVGKSFRNEITPGNFIFRTREFEQMEMEFFCRPEESIKFHEFWQTKSWEFLLNLGINQEKIRIRAHDDEELSHYSSATSDIEYQYPFGWGELWGIAHRGDFDLTAHSNNEIKKELSYRDPQTNEVFIPHCIEPSVGLDRLLLTVLLDAFNEEEDRTILKIDPKLAAYKVAIMPLTNKLAEPAQKLFDDVAKMIPATFETSGSIGKRYYKQDAIGTPFCITFDFDSLEDNMVTIRNRDTQEQERIKIDEILNYVSKFL